VTPLRPVKIGTGFNVSVHRPPPFEVAGMEGYWQVPEPTANAFVELNAVTPERPVVVPGGV
jgi:hypothetical protein